MKTLIVCLPILATACIKTGSFSTSSPGGGDGNVTIPNVFKLKKADAIDALHKAGVQGDIDSDDNLCGSTIDGKIVELGEVCYQHPAAGQVQGARLVVSLRVQTEDPRHGDIGKNTEWRLMPNVIGMTYDQAIAEIQRAGFTHAERIKTADAEDPGDASCKPRIVCREYPEPLGRAGLNDDKLLYMGADPTAPSHVASSDPPPPSHVEPTRPAPTPTPTPAPAPAPTKPTADQAPAPLFGAPPPPPAKPDPKPPAGDAKPAHRDGDGRVHGPGGPVFMGRGEPCTAKRDHCLRAPVWFMADNAVAGELFRGVPVFPFEGTWWKWTGDQVQPKRLFRTVVVDRPDQVQAGKPVVIFSQEGNERFLDSEYAMMTSSRWEVAFVDAVGTDTVKIKGWGDVPLDTVRQIVEEK